MSLNKFDESVVIHATQNYLLQNLYLLKKGNLERGVIFDNKT